MRIDRLALFALFCRIGYAGLLNSDAIDPALFRVTLFASAPFPGGMMMTQDGALLVATSPAYTNGAILRLTDANLDGVADGPGSVVYSGTGSGPFTQMQDSGRFLVLAEQGSTTLRFLVPGGAPGDPYTSAGTLTFDFPAFWLHDNLAIAVRPIAGNPDTFELFVNIGSRDNDSPSVDPVGVQGLGLGPTSLAPDSIYRFTISQAGSVPEVLGTPQQIAAGIRNAFGLAFHPTTGDLYFSDNAINLAVSPYEEPPQADELNVLSAGLIGNTVPHFGYPNCYIEYITGSPVGSGCQLPLVAFQPIDGRQTEGSAQIAFAPAPFPNGLNNGVFVGFFGEAGVPVNNESGVAFYDFDTGQYFHFIRSGNPDSYNPIWLHSTNNSLFVGDFGTGSVWQISSSIPEPASVLLTAGGLAVLGWRKRQRRR